MTSRTHDDGWCERDALFNPERYPAFRGAGTVHPFQPEAPLSSVNAWWLANASHLAYYDKDDLVRALSPQGFALSHFASQRGSQAYIAESDHIAILAFRGTRHSEFSNLRNDIDIRRFPVVGNVFVHHGFFRSLMAIWTGLEIVLAQIEKPVWYTGHSLGGAMALLATLLRPPTATHVFGAPRVGNESFARLIGGLPVACYVNCCDIVPRLPPGALAFADAGVKGYQSADHRLLSSLGSWERRLDWLKGQLMFVRLGAWVRPECVGLRALSDHIILNYSAAIRQVIN